MHTHAHTHAHHHHYRYYTANQMKLVVIGRESLDDLEKMVRGVCVCVCVCVCVF